MTSSVSASPSETGFFYGYTKTLAGLTNLKSSAYTDVRHSFNCWQGGSYLVIGY